jgi:radical SAM superfamily enzyme YgiQ (UPF0313 family)
MDPKQPLAGLRVALIFPDFLQSNLASHQDNGRFLGLVPPLSLLYVAAVLRRAGAVAMVIDCPASGLSLEGCIRELEAFKPDYVGLTLTTVDWAGSLSHMEEIHARLGVHILVGGIHMECYPRETLTHSCIALGFVGHADQGLVEALVAHQEGQDLAGVPGVVYRDEEGEVQLVPATKAPRGDETLPFPARDLIDNGRYHTIVSTERNFTAAMSNFGCPYGCEFCILRASPVRQRSAKSIVDEMEYCHREHDIREMDFFDPVFTMRRDRAIEVCDQIVARGLHKKMIWSIRARTDTLDPGLLDRLWGAGCRRIYFGIESGSPVVRKRVSKSMISNEHIISVLEATKKRGFEVLAFVMIGNPLEDKHTVAQTRRLVRHPAVDFVQVASFFPLPNTPIYKEIVARSGRDYWKEHVLHGTSIHPVQRLDTVLTPDEVDALVTRTYVGFYFRPSFVWRAIKRTRDPELLRRGVAAAVGVGRTFAEGLVPRR